MRILHEEERLKDIADALKRTLRGERTIVIKILGITVRVPVSMNPDSDSEQSLLQRLLQRVFLTNKIRDAILQRKKSKVRSQGSGGSVLGGPEPSRKLAQAASMSAAAAGAKAKAAAAKGLALLGNLMTGEGAEMDEEEAAAARREAWEKRRAEAAERLATECERLVEK
jgi:hypothetical protein